MQQNLQHPLYSYALVSTQFGFIALLLFATFPWQMTTWSLSIHTFGALLGLWALKTMHLGHFNIIPDPMPHLELVTTGPYAFIRHPMYASILLFFIPLPILDSSLFTWSLYIILCATLLLKLHYEEALICQKTADYAIYQSHSKKLIPWVW